ncbi:hypothetical protein L6452_31184 [Arctium lappa]|uniref:Uncharacterized protein n=1 Tax=Arctium lappa TaxID=4217 RepID=A0ACB8ZJR2_ARCLA|nr:hypothetical protein L6452_31184 [Arctium lappa]
MLEDGNCLFRVVADQVYGVSEEYDLASQIQSVYIDTEGRICLDNLNLLLKLGVFSTFAQLQNDTSRGGITGNRVQEKTMIMGLLDGSGEYTLVYKDNERDRMLVGDVPSQYIWQIYLERLLTLARVYGFWKHVSKLDRLEIRCYLEMFYILKYHKLVSRRKFISRPKMAQSELDKINLSSSGEELSSEGSDSESETDKTPPPLPSSIKPQSTSKSSSGEYESDGDSPPKQCEKSDPNIKPLASKPMDDEPLRKPRPKNPISRYSPPPLKSPTGKRKASEIESETKESKIEKKEVATLGSENAGEKKQLFQRLWSEDDEIQLIKGMINYVENKGKDPIADVNDFHEFVKNSLNIDVNNGQMSAKVKRLKAKFMNNIGKIEQNGKVRSLSNPHEKKMYELSEKLWGRYRNKNAAFVSCSTKKVNAKPLTNQKRKNSNSLVYGEANVNNNGIEVSAAEVGQNVVHSSAGLSQRGVIRGPMTDEDIMNKGLEMVSGPKKVELEEKWDDLKVQEFKHFLKKLELMHEQAELLLNALKESDTS